MSPEAQRIAIAEACGYRWMDYCHQGICKLYPPVPKLDECHGWYFTERREGTDLSSVPDYLNDLNAMHEAEKTLLTGDGWKDRLAKYSSKLMTVMHDTDFGRIDVAFKNDMVHLRYFTLHATAAQRAEAFLRTTGLWKD